MSDARSPQIPPPPELGEITDYDSMLSIFRRRAAERQIAVGGEAVAEISGLPIGYCQKLLCDPPVKNIGRISLGPLLGVLGLKLIAVEDPDALRRFGTRLPQRKQCWVRTVRSGVTLVELSSRHMRKIGRKGGASRAENLSPAARSEAASKAARLRWAKVDKQQRREIGRALAKCRWKPRTRRRRSRRQMWGAAR